MVLKIIRVNLNQNKILDKEWDTNTNLKIIRDELKNLSLDNFIFLDKEDQEIPKEIEENKILNEILDGRNLYLKKEKKQRIILGNKIDTINDLDIYLYPTKELTNEEKEISSNIIVFGETGVGKSTWIQGLINYIQEIQIEEKIRYYLFNEKEMQIKYKKENGEKSMGSSVTDIPSIYDIEKSNIYNYPIRIIDTAGFGDTRGEEYDEKIMKDILEFFEKNDITNINSICIIFKSTETRAHERTKDILNKIFSLFGEDTITNIIIIYTFADCGNYIPALKTLQDETLPFPKNLNINNLAYFCFNSKAYFTNDIELYSKIFEKNIINYNNFFKYISNLNRISLDNSKKVIRNRIEIKLNIIELFKKLNKEINPMKNEYKSLTLKINEVNNNIYSLPNIERREKYYETSYYDEKVKKYNSCSSGYYVCYCNCCERVCHHSCRGPSEGVHSSTYGCSIIKSIGGYCSSCDCHYRRHEYKTYYYSYDWETRTKYIEKYRDNPNYFKNEEKRTELQRKKNELEENRNNVNKNIHDCLLYGINILYEMAIKNNEINNMALKKDDIKYGFIQNILNKKIKYKYENNMILSNFQNILSNIENIYKNQYNKENTINDIQNNLINN